jgi:hypothetical protein
MRVIAKKCGLEKDYLGHYSFFSEATHSGHIELSGIFSSTQKALALKQSSMDWKTVIGPIG